ncbi:MAG: hypothetical protein HQL08_15745 [Nitrospirae bacterium]|nr:hypothetical protein [Nitrospirota bacterium]
MASSSRLKPGQKGAIVARISSLNKTGLTVESVEVLSNDPKRPKIVLTLQATILRNQ